MDTLVLVKHAPPRIEPTAPAPTWPLTGEGRALCRPLAAAAARFSPTAVVASREAKAAETGILLARHLGVPFSTCEALHEHDRRGFPFLPDRGAFLARMKDAFARPADVVVGNESIDQARDRFSAALLDLASRHSGGALAAVSHGTVIAAFVARATGVDPYSLWVGLRHPSLVALTWPALRLAGTWNVEAPSPPA